MEQTAFFAVDLDGYREALDKAGTRRKLAMGRLENCTGILRGFVVSAVAAGLSQSEVAKLAGVPRQTVRDWLGK